MFASSLYYQHLNYRFKYICCASLCRSLNKKKEKLTSSIFRLTKRESLSFNVFYEAENGGCGSLMDWSLIDPS